MGHKVIYLKKNTLTEQYTPYQMQFITNTKDHKSVESNPLCYFTHFLGRNEMNDQKEVVIKLFLKEYFREKEKFLWSYEPRAYIKEDELVIVISKL